MLKKYQIFVGATYNDLMEERSAAINQIIKQRHIIFLRGWKTLEQWEKSSGII